MYVQRGLKNEDKIAPTKKQQKMHKTAMYSATCIYRTTHCFTFISVVLADTDDPLNLIRTTPGFDPRSVPHYTVVQPCLTAVNQLATNLL